MSAEQTPTLVDPIVAHCFLSLAGCEHTVSGFDADEVHDRMEEHYATNHRAYIDAVTGVLR